MDFSALPTTHKQGQAPTTPKRSNLVHRAKRSADMVQMLADGQPTLQAPHHSSLRASADEKTTTAPA
jgi:hypothetical protein